jgi:Leucine-rich repeat (LRR) protein
VIINKYSLNTSEDIKLRISGICSNCKIKIFNLKGVVNTNVVFDTDDTLFANNAKLKTLQLENNQLDTLPKSIFNLKSLKYIEITNNPLRKLINFENFKNLEIIHLENLKISYSEFKNGPQKLPENIKVLVLDKLRLNVMPFEFSSSTSQLKELVFSGIPWISSELSRISRSRSQKNVMFDKETIIEQLNRIFDAQESAKLFSYFDPANSGFLQTEELNKLNAFIFKRLPRLGDNDNFLDFGGITPSIFELTNLTSLNLSYQAIKSIPSQIENLINLEELILSNCIVLETISAKTSSLTKLKELSLVECISLKTPPPEIVKRGFASIISYLSRLLMGEVLCKRTKLMLVGLGEAGKTSLLNALIKRRKSNQRPKITDGIDIKDWIVDLEDKSQLTYSMWDFAGQSVYYNTHQFFLTSRAVYLLVW